MACSGLGSEQEAHGDRAAGLSVGGWREQLATPAEGTSQHQRTSSSLLAMTEA